MTGTALAGKTALVLGAAGRDNMGQAIALRFIAEGATVLVAGRHADELDRFIAANGGYRQLCDITDEVEVQNLAEAARAALGQIDIAVNASGWGFVKPFELTTAEELRKITALQFIGPFQFMQAMLSVMADGGSLIQISSATATTMLNDHAAYMGTKAGMDHVMRCIAHEQGVRGIRANSVSPGITATPMTAGAQNTPGVFEAFLASYPLGRVGTSDDIAAACVWLAREDTFVTGQNLQINGGLLLRGNPGRDDIDRHVVARTGKPRPHAWQ